MNQTRLSWLANVLALSALPAALTIQISHAADSVKPNLTGSYTLTGAKGAFEVNKVAPWRLNVVQTDLDIEVTMIADGRTTTNRFKLDGGESPYTSQGGVKGTSTGRFKGRTLVLETMVTAHPQPNGPAVQLHTKQQWALSPDSKTLTIRNDVDFPNSGLGGFQLVAPWSEIYTKGPQ
jgi:hypothetical protein